MVDGLKADLQGQAALKERAGQKVPELLLKQIAETTVDQQRLQQQISRYLSNKSDLERDFLRDKTRLVELLKNK